MWVQSVFDQIFVRFSNELKVLDVTRAKSKQKVGS